MVTAIDPDRQKRIIWAILAIAGPVLLIVGWYRFIG
jgi:hypothetical protein